MGKLTETVTVTRDVPYQIADLVYFVRHLETHGKLVVGSGVDDALLVSMARLFYDTQHGEG